MLTYTVTNIHHHSDKTHTKLHLQKRGGCFVTRATTSASTTGMPLALKRLETVLFPDAMPPVSPTILIPLSAPTKVESF